MKNQYFGDTRDLFKFDLILRIMEGIPSIRSLTFIPMLTPDDGTSGGSRIDLSRARAGYLNIPLALHLSECVRGGRRNLAEILPFFAARKVSVNFHGESFTGKDRAAYLRAVPETWLQEALVFLDPDIGLEVARPGEKHLLYDEVRVLSARMGIGSVLMLFQFFPRVRRDAYMQGRGAELEKMTRCPVFSISDNQIAFFFLVPEPVLREEVRGILTRYREDYPRLVLSRPTEALHRYSGEFMRQDEFSGLNLT